MLRAHVVTNNIYARHSILNISNLWPPSLKVAVAVKTGAKFMQKNEEKKLKIHDIAYLVYHMPHARYDVIFFRGK